MQNLVRLSKFSLFKILSPNNYLKGIIGNFIRPIACDSQSFSEIKCASHGSLSNPSIALSHHGSKLPIIYLSILHHKSSINPNKQLGN